MTNDSNPLISIIIPAYNVENYIFKCVSSALEQSYENIEVVVINDGSTDNTKKILDGMALKDKRIIVLHKENFGVSAARNSGIELSNGEYLIFVDGDDYIASDYVSYMMSLVESTGSDFCLSTKCFTKHSERQTENEYISVLTNEEATALLISPDVIVGCWNKIFKRSLIVDNEILFSTSLFYGEGLTFITTISQISDSIGIGNRKVYYYRRNNEDSATTRFDINKLYNGEQALNNIKSNLTVSSDRIDTMWSLHMCTFTLGALIKIRANGVKNEYSKDYRRWKKYINKNAFPLVVSNQVTAYRRMLILGGCISPWLMMNLDSRRRKRISAQSVED